MDHRVSALISIDEMNTTDTGLRRHRGGQERVVGRRPGACSAKAVLQPQEKTSPWKISRGICSVQTAKKGHRRRQALQIHRAGSAVRAGEVTTDGC